MRCVCLHGHFYQPPRENPWTGSVDAERGAGPFHDWNSRICHECYGPNCAAVFSGRPGRDEIINNYSLISFNFGPTLLSWLEEKAPLVYLAVLEADRLSSSKRSGHGNAIAQVYNHIILPLAPLKDKRTQVRWGMADFERRFKRKPEALWLSETAADDETLEVLCEHALRYAILAPSQALRVRPMGAEKWAQANEQTLDSTMAYRWFSKAAPGRSIDLFFYSSPAAKAFYLGGALRSPARFSAELLSAFTKEYHKPQLSHFAADGEYYGHHCRIGHITLAQTLSAIERERTARVTNYGEFLDGAPPKYEAEIVSPSSWSCAHGVERWRADCGCKINPAKSSSQAWRAVLRGALDSLAGKIDALYEREAAKIFKDPWAARDGACGARSFLAAQAGRNLRPQEVRAALKLLEMQRMRLFMFTSCGWFFDELSGIEPVQLMKYASRAMELASGFGENFEQDFLSELKTARSNLSRYEDGAEIYRLFAASCRVSAERAASDFCLSKNFSGGLPFSADALWRYKIIDEDSFSAAGAACEALRFHQSDVRVLEQNFYSAFVFRKPSGPECFIKTCRSAAEHEALVRTLSGGAACAALSEAGYKFYGISDMTPERRTIAAALSAASPDPVEKLVKNLVNAIRAAGGDMLGDAVFSAVSAFTREDAAPLFSDEIRHHCLGKFERALERFSAAELSGLEKWLGFFAGESPRERAWDFRLVLGDFIAETDLSAAKPEFQSAVFQIMKIIGLNYGYKKVKA